jgi:hypothetical protein
MSSGLPAPTVESKMLPFYDEAALGVLRGVEARVYQHLQRQAP